MKEYFMKKETEKITQISACVCVIERRRIHTNTNKTCGVFLLPHGHTYFDQSLYKTYKLNFILYTMFLYFQTEICDSVVFLQTLQNKITMKRSRTPAYGLFFKNMLLSTFIVSKYKRWLFVFLFFHSYIFFKPYFIIQRHSHTKTPTTRSQLWLKNAHHHHHRLGVFSTYVFVFIVVRCRLKVYFFFASLVHFKHCASSYK